MKIAHVLGSFSLAKTPDESSLSGVVRAALELAQAQTRRGHDVTVVAVGTEAWVSSWQGVKLVQLRWQPNLRLELAGRTLDFSVHAPLVRFTRRNDFDVVQGHLYYYLRFLKAKLRVSHFHADPFYAGSDPTGPSADPSTGPSAEQVGAAKRAEFRLIARCSSAQVAVSHFIAEEVRRGFALSGAQANLYTVPNGVLHERFNTGTVMRRGARQELGLAEDAVAFLFVGAVVATKGLLTLAKAFAVLAKQDPRVHLLVAGSASLWDMAAGPQPGHGRGYERHVLEQLQPLLAAGRVQVLGSVTNAAIPRVYAASDVVVVPSIWREAFPLVALEALASGKPLIASAVGGLPEVVTADNGCLVPPGDETALYAAMRTFLEPELRQRRGAAARQSAQHFSWDKAAAQLERVYTTPLSVSA